MSINLYLQVRKKEGRLYSDDVVAQLPSFPKHHALSSEWQARFQSAKRLRRYLSQKKCPLKILDVGCGNGWLSNFLTHGNHFVYGIDQNLFELKQAARVFSKNSKLSFLEADIFSAPFLKESFDVIIIASAIQYFPDLTKLLQTLFDYLKPNGEIHILDSAFYSDDEIPQAIHRSDEYYSSLGFPEMSQYYFHYRTSELEKFSPKWMYHPNLWMLKIKRIFGKIDSPFAWVMIKNQ